MEKITYGGKDDEVKNMADFISQQALGNIIIRDTAPTSAEMKANTFAYYNSKLYFKTASGVLLRIDATII